MDKYKEVIDQLIRQNPKALIAYGSTVWGKPHEGSDLDILMIKSTKKSYRDRIRNVHLQLRTRLPIDVIVLTPEEFRVFANKYSFYNNIVQNGKVIYGRA